MLLSTALLTTLGTLSPGSKSCIYPFCPLVGWLQAGTGLCYRKLFMGGFLSRDDKGICGQRKVDAGNVFSGVVEVYSLDLFVFMVLGMEPWASALSYILGPFPF